MKSNDFILSKIYKLNTVISLYTHKNGETEKKKNNKYQW